MKLLFTAFAILCTAVAFGQQAPCAFDQYQRKHQPQMAAAEERIQQALAQTQGLQYSHTPGLKIIPVVVHVIHDGGTENISEAQIQSQIAVLNEDFRRIAGTPGEGAGVDALVEFCLAKKDPQGRCTNGIVRVQNTLSVHQTYQRSLLKQLSYWDNTRYLNMYVVKSINGSSGILGYSSFPGGPADEDGIVVRHDYFGNIGTAAGGMGRTTTHEIGHWFGLYHTFQGGCGTSDTCNTGDNVCDTPPVANPNFGCPSPTINSCSNDSYPDQIANYLDYTDDNCKSMFTLGQKNRMHAALAALRPAIWTAWNIDSTGCDSGFANGPCAVIPNFIALNTQICTGSSITFYDRSQNNPLSYNWTFGGGSPASSSAANPTVTYTTPGVYDVKLIATNAQGTDSLVRTAYVTVTIPPTGQALPFAEDFETPVFPSGGILIDNPDGGITWERDTVAVAYDGRGSAKINNLINTNYGQSDAMELPAFDFTSVSVPQRLYFYYAYARSDPNYSDELIVLASKDCGVNWTQLFYRTGNTLATGPTQITPYLPDTATVWKKANISLAPYAGEQNVRIRIVNVTDGGNNLYIDNINIGLWPLDVSENVIAEDAVKIFPNPAHDQLELTTAVPLLAQNVRLLNLLGAEVGVTLTAKGAGVYSIAIPVGTAPGMYYLTLETAQGRVVRKISLY